MPRRDARPSRGGPAAVLAALLLAAVARWSSGAEGPAASGAGPEPRDDAPLIRRGPYLQAVAGSQAVVCWRTDRAAAAHLEYAREGLGPAALRSPAVLKDHCLTLTGLERGASYAYRVLSGRPSDWHSFRAAELPGARLRFAAFGDSGKETGHGGLAAVGRALAADPPDFILHLGDVVYPRGADEGYDALYFAPYASFLPGVCVYPAAGNHDYANIHWSSGRGRAWLQKNFLSIFRLPEPDLPRPADEGPPTYYSFDRGSAHFVAVDANRTFAVPAAPAVSPESPQLRWVEADLAASTAAWKFVFLHEAVYSTGGHGSYELLQDALAPILERHGVDVVFQGHDHHYERTVPLLAGRAATAGRGTVYVVAGIGGASLGRRHSRSAWTAVFERRHGFARVTLDGRRLTLDGVGADGKVFDRWERVK